MFQIDLTDDGERRRNGIRREPANGSTFFRLNNMRLTLEDAAYVGWRNPMLTFCRQDVVDHIQQIADCDLHTVFLYHLAFQGIRQGFAKFDAAAGEFPTAALIFGLFATLGQKKTSQRIDDDGTDSHADIIYTSFHPSTTFVQIKPGYTRSCDLIMKNTRNLVPDGEYHSEIVVVNSRFVASIAPVFSVETAREFIAKIRALHPEANHHVPAFIIGHGASVTEHCSDDGEPQGTAGRPALAVLKGSGLGDVVVVVTRYFGGTKLGTGGLVRAYTDAVKAVLSELPLAEKIAVHTALLVLPYPYYERARQLVAAHGGRILDEDFAGDITLTLRFTTEAYPAFQQALRELSSGTLQAEIVETDPAAIFPIADAD